MSIPMPSRAELRERRRAIPPAARMAAAEAVAGRLLALPGAPAAGHVAGYWAMDGELPLHAWQLGLPAGCVYCLPVLDDARRALRFAPWRAGDALVTNRFGIPEPDLGPTALLDAGDMALIALPLTGFDARAHRVGMGGGWYDRTLAFRRKSTAPPHCVGIGFDVQQVPAIAPQAWDVPCDAIVTESRTILRTP
ncbi:5-formyltetrahydrofolate cyclo-ligase [Lysobacter pythonis]|uniref:5-formyltetrahydrofolate cyclo-ligase n=2 Tax=Solilutibacter pythonis TaxID=2483112 RepID=A0A3M2I598_9GAMM|nr:5-formyltetrahydrofolate cyclo-ligase [Lysobacter pythonis]RMH93434.1 5-formyltetrahydrofolate cyclo-ligase [Lysobacter pythonis]